MLKIGKLYKIISNERKVYNTHPEITFPINSIVLCVYSNKSMYCGDCIDIDVVFIYEILFEGKITSFRFYMYDYENGKEDNSYFSRVFKEIPIDETSCLA
jgi:hypothetical protein